MPNISADEIVTLKHKRNYIQFGGARPSNSVLYAGQNAQYMAIDGLTIPEIGGVDPIWVPDPRRIGQYRLVGRSLSPADLPTATVMMREKHGSIPRQLTKIGCSFNLYESTGTCRDLSDFLGGWTDYVLIYSGAIVTDKDGGTRSAFDADDPVEDSLSITLSYVYPVGPIGFGEGASTLVSLNVIDIVYGSVESCGSCSPEDDGSKRIYAIASTSGVASPGLPAELIYTVDGGLNWNQTNINGFGATEVPLAIDIVGNYVMVLGLDAYYYAEINLQTGVPGSFTKVSSGFLAAGSPNDIYVAGPREIYFCGDLGYIYKSTDITAGVTVISAGTATVQNLSRIHGKDEVIVATGALGAVVKTSNRGLTWASTTTSPDAAVTIQAICVVDSLLYWVGTSGGKVFYTPNGGESWTEKTFTGSGSGVVRDIVFATQEVGWIAHNTSTPAGYILSTWDGGADWTRTTPRIMNWPTLDYIGRIAFPDVDPSIAANNVALAGLAGDGTDGIILIGSSVRL